MLRDVWADIERCRRAGLIVDEDFERGISPRQRRWRIAGLAIVVIVLGIAASYLVVGSGVQDAARRQRAPIPRVKPVGTPPAPAHKRGRT